MRSLEPKVAGRCFCGVIDEWMAKDPDEHLECWNLRWCKKCGEAAPFAANCVFCHRAQARRWAERQRILNSRHYTKSKEAKRKKYRTDTAYAERCREAYRRRYARKAA